MRWLVLILALWSGPLWAVEADEMLDDPLLERRAQALDDAIRCVRCQSESIASSNAEWASDARIRVRELLVDGASDTEVLDFFVARYGEVVLMEPRLGGSNLVLWLAGPLMLLLAAGGAVYYVRQRGRATETRADELSAEEQARLRDILDR
ncbi:cytochrome c-type biogenesis protein CcmH [Roseovarius sp. SCSIO 43702]|uniref:cytochrome c-type biogenesis protein n=1 Tax=Roseovarius sp. SCSIO 43702 TaxID=2823043 RepID=UPI001C7375F2|nr:cytochrome c-type biogenesis protein [Roseovarius sp. SCSIO 43702]QYX58358.1 cytochrome c-type biogenesis protein CcmH [Roseovarius sp. SCSIO 43702]